MSAQWPVRTFIYIGDRLTAKGSLQTGFITLPEGEETTITVPEVRGLSTGWWALKGRSRSSVRTLRVGAVVTMEASEAEDGGCSIRLPSLRTVSAEWVDREMVLRWTAEHRADRAEAERRKAMKGRDALQEALDPIRDMYRSLRGSHRTAMLAEIVRYITN